MTRARSAEVQFRASAGVSLNPACNSFVTPQLCGVMLWTGWVVLTLISGSFAYGVPALSRPVFTVTLLLIILSTIHLLAVWLVRNSSDKSITLFSVISLALAMRFVTIFSTPIQELDYYRYMWDGETVLAGENPFRVVPAQIVAAASTQLTDSDVLIENSLVEICRQRPRVYETAARVHYGELPTIYPPVSLAVFAIAAATTPESASLETATVILRMFIVSFDVGIIFWMIRLLKHLGWSPQLVISWAWCPLVVKEFANSGHLDAIAVFFMVGSITLLVIHLFPACKSVVRRRKVRNLWGITMSAGLFGLAVGAKLFPVVLVPVIAGVVLRRSGLRQCFIWICVAGITGVVCCLPMLLAGSEESKAGVLAESHDGALVIDPLNNIPTTYQHEEPPVPGKVAMNEGDLSEESFSTPNNASPYNMPPRSSLKVFLTSWKMNDLIFMIIEGNLTPEQSQFQQKDQWFVLVPKTVRDSITEMIRTRFRVSSETVPFLLTRCILSIAFLAVAIRLAWAGMKCTESADWLALVFSTLAWFWVLSPTLNPWYWSWALPFILFARHRVWEALSVIVFVYYLRFWFAYQWDSRSVLWTRYQGESFFHYVVVWFEHLPWMLLLAFQAMKKRFRASSRTVSPIQ
ncbi:MAG: hypothetical protein JNL58_25500 [Planctomyces sp.]|nr:hypothetical protein [Planctomyces sp.]